MFKTKDIFMVVVNVIFFKMKEMNGWVAGWMNCGLVERKSNVNERAIISINREIIRDTYI